MNKGDNFLLNSLAVECPELCKEWHATKNFPLTPMNTPYGSKKKVWWTCSVCLFEWQAFISNRRKQYKKADRKGTGCPNCFGGAKTLENAFGAEHPELVKEWHPTKNETSPYHITRCSGVKCWWICETCKYEWEATASSRGSGSGCPKCNGT